MLHSPDEPLMPLHDTNNNPIANFPSTPREIQGLQGTHYTRSNVERSLIRLLARTLGQLLQALGTRDNGSKDEKVARFRLLVGLRTDVA